jgi:hypothetical protein
MSREDAYLHVKARRPRIQPNIGFWKQLGEYEKQCRQCEVSHRPSEVASFEAETPTAIPLDADWIKRSNALYVTCHESPEILHSSKLHWQLQEVDRSPTACHAIPQHLLSSCLDLVWGRGLVDVDLDWLVYICDTLDSAYDGYNDGAANTHSSSRQIVTSILQDHDSDFWNIWAGEVYDNQLKKVYERIGIEMEKHSGFSICPGSCKR